MPETVIKLDNISKQYRLGTVGTKTIRGDLQRWWYRINGKEDPTLKIGQANQLDKSGSKDGNLNDYVWALKDINLEVKQGEILGIIGKNGAGKSTLLKLLSRVTGPTTGEIKVKGRIASLLEVGTGFHPELTGRENIFLNGAILGMTKTEIRSKFDEIVDFAGVAKYIDTPVKRYSSGMYVRLAFAVAAHLEPDILVVDEVLAVGDAEFQKKAIGKMQDVSRGEGRTVLFVSHNMASIKALCNRGLLLQNGLQSYEGPIVSVVDKYILKTNTLNNYNYFYDINSDEGTKHLFVGDIKVNGKKEFIVKNTEQVEIEFIISNPHKLHGYLEIASSIRDKNDNHLHYSSSKLKAKQFFIDSVSTHSCFLTFNKLPFHENDYFFSIELKFNNEFVSVVRKAFMIKIIEDDFYSHGVVWTLGCVLLDQDWH